MKLKPLFLSIAIALQCTSCATIFTGTADILYFESDPSGAEIYIDGLKVCTTPCDVLVKRSLTDKLVELQLDGYETRVITLDRKFNPVSIINLGKLIFWGIDAATGALMKYDRKDYQVKMKKESRTAFSNPIRIDILSSEKRVDVYQIADSK